MDLHDDYLAAATYWGIAVAIADWSTSNPDGPYSGDNPELYAARDLAGSATAYDWMWPDLTQQERHDWLGGLVAHTDELYHYADIHLSESDPDNWTTLDQNFQRRVVLNGHRIEPYSAVGVASLVTDVEMNHGSSSADWYEWSHDADDFFDTLRADLPDDGADHNGVEYWEQNTIALLQYLEAEKTIAAIDWTDQWVKNNEAFLRASTDPDGERVMLGDSDNGDYLPYPAAHMARVAHTFSADAAAAPLAQDLSWAGFNAQTPGRSGKPGERDVWDILWWDTSVVRQTDAGSPVAPSPDQCFEQSGLVSLTSLGGDPTHFVFRGGPLIGGHDDPDVGSFVLYKHGHLVSTDGGNNQAKRTAGQSTLLVDGWGQHGDGAQETDSVPEGRPNNAYRVGYLDALGRASDGTLSGPQMVTAGVELSELYKVVGTNDATGLVSPSEDANLTSLTRWFVWVPGAVTLFDPFTATNSVRVDWNLQTAVFDGDVPEHCAIEPGTGGNAGYYRYDGSGGTEWLRFPGDGTADRPGSSTSLAMHDTVNNDLDPVLACLGSSSCATACPDWNVGSFTPAGNVTIGSGTGTGRLRVDTVDSISSSLDRFTSSYGDGSTAFGYRYGRNVTASSGALLTVLRPYVDGGSAVNLVNISSVSNGSAVDIGTKFVELFKNPGVLSVSFGSPATSTTGTIGVFEYTIGGQNQSVTHAAMQMIGGTSLVDHGVTLLSAGNAIDVSAGVGPDSFWGTVAGVTSSTVVTININGAYTSGTSTGLFYPAGGGLSTLPASYSAGGASITVLGDGTFTVPYPSHSSSVEPASACFR